MLATPAASSVIIHKYLFDCALDITLTQLRARRLFVTMGLPIGGGDGGGSHKTGIAGRLSSKSDSVMYDGPLK